MGTGTDVTAVSDVDDVVVITGVCDVGTGTNAGVVTAESDVDDVAVTIGVCDVGRRQALVT